MGDIMTTKEIAEQLAVTERTVINWITSGKLIAYKFGLAYRVKKEDFMSFIDNSKVDIKEKGDKDNE